MNENNGIKGRILKKAKNMIKVKQVFGSFLLFGIDDGGVEAEMITVGGWSHRFWFHHTKPEENKNLFNHVDYFSFASFGGWC